MQTAQELKDYFRTTLVAQRTIAQEFLALDALVDFANQNDNTNIPDWTGSLTFQLDGSDDGTFCTEPDTNGRIRFFKTKVNNNTNNAPPTDPLITENAYWIEVSPGDGSAVKEWAAGVYGEGLIIVYFDTSGTGADPDLYVLAEATRPFHSTNFTTELAAGKWKRMQTVFDVAATGGTDVMNIGTTNADVINIGRVGATVNIYGNTIYSQVTNLEVSDKLIRLNRGGAADSAGGSGFELEENAVVTGYIKTTSDRNGYELKAPNQAGIVTLEFNASGDLIIKPAGTTKLTVSSTGAAVAGNVSNTGALFFSGAVSPAQITGNQNDYNPTDFHNYANVRLSSDASRDITGFGAPVAGEFKVVHNVGSFDIVFKNSDAGSAAANRFALNADFTLKADQSTIFWYDPTSSRWRAIQAGSGGAVGAWSLASGGTLTNTNTITSNAANQLNFTGTWTATANSQYMAQFSGTITSRNTASDDIYGYVINPTINRNAGAPAGQSAVALYVNPTIDANIPNRFGIAAVTSSSSSFGGLRIMNTSTGSAFLDLVALSGGSIGTSSQFYIERNNGANGLVSFNNSGTGNMLFSTNGTNRLSISGVSGSMSLTQSAQSSGWASLLTTTPGAHTAMTASTEFISRDFVGASWQWNAGTITRQSFNYFRGFTVTGASATATITDAYNVYVERTTASTNATITRNWAAGFDGNISVTSNGGLVIGGTTDFTIAGLATTVPGHLFVGGVTNASINIGTSTSRFSFISGGANLLYLRGVSTAAIFQFDGNSGGGSGLGGVYITQGVQTSGWTNSFKITPGNHTSITATLENIDFDFGGTNVTQTWAGSGTVATQRQAYFRGRTLAGASAQTFTNAYTLYVDPPVAGTNATITNIWAAGFNGNVQVGDQLYLGNNSMAGATRAIGVLGSATDIGLQIATKGLGNLSMYGNSVTLGGASYASGSVGVIRIQGNNSSTANQAGSSIEILSGAGTAGNANSGDIYLDLGAKAGTGKVGNIGLFSTNTDFDGAEKVLRIGSRTTAPSGTIVADHAYLYVEDIAAGNAAVHFMTEAGDIVKMYAISGWGTPTNTLTRTTFDTSTVTLQQLAERVGALISDLKTGHGLLKA